MHAPSRPATANRRRLNPFLRTVDALSMAAGVVAAAMLVAAVAITCQMIWVRFVLNGSTVWQTETIIYLMIASTLLGLSYVQRQRGHVYVDAVLIVLPRGTRKLLVAATLGVSLCVVGAMIFYGGELWHLAWARNWTSDTVWGAPLWIPYLAIPVGLALYFLQMAADLYAELIGADEVLIVEYPPGADAGRDE